MATRAPKTASAKKAADAPKTARARTATVAPGVEEETAEGTASSDANVPASDAPARITRPLASTASAADSDVDADPTNTAPQVFHRPYGSEPRNIDTNTGTVIIENEGPKLADPHGSDHDPDVDAGQSAADREALNGGDTSNGGNAGE